MLQRFVVLDRDGTINVERHYLSHPDQVELIANAALGLAALNTLGLGLIVVTNQSGVGRGMFDVARLDAIHARLRDLLAAEGVRLDGIYYCPHLPDAGCRCRKPLAWPNFRRTACWPHWAGPSPPRRGRANQRHRRPTPAVRAPRRPQRFKMI